MTTTTTMTPIATHELHELIEHALRDLKRARFANDRTGIVRSERRMNALLDQLAKRLPSNRGDAARRGNVQPRVVQTAPGFS